MKNQKYVRKGDWDVTGLSDAEIDTIIQNSYKRAQADRARGNYYSVDEFFQKFNAEHRAWTATA